MRMRHLATLFLVAAATWAQQPANPRATSAPSPTSRPGVAIKPASEILGENRSSIAVIVAGGDTSVRLGTGFFVRSTGLLLTNFHVVEGTDLVGVKIAGSTDFLWARKATGFDLDNDLVLLEVETTGRKSVAIGDSDQVQVGEQIVVIGNPEGLEQTVSNGLLSGIRELDGRKLFQISAPISSGSSGSPVFDTRGEVIGVVVSTLESGQNLNFAIPINYAKPLLSRTTEEQISTLPKRNRGDIQREDGNIPSASTTDPAKLAVQAVSEIANQIKACPQTVLIRRGTDKKLPFYAVREGPPKDVSFDVRPSDSLVAPFQGIIEFSTRISNSQDAKTPEQAASAPEAYSSLTLAPIYTWLHRYFYRVSGSEVYLDHRTFYDRARGEWVPDPDGRDTCWDRIANQ